VKQSLAALATAMTTTWLAQVTSADHAKLTVKTYIQRAYTRSTLIINGVLKDFIQQGSRTD
jgi:hypothetical protein